jgi:hypothetical protein
MTDLLLIKRSSYQQCFSEGTVYYEGTAAAAALDTVSAATSLMVFAYPGCTYLVKALVALNRGIN